MQNFSIEPFGVCGAISTKKLNLYLSSGLKRYHIVDSKDKKVAIIYGCILQGHIKSGVILPGNTVKSDFEICSTTDFERFLLGLNGSFVVETLPPLPHRLYPDAGCTIPIVFCPESQRIASSAGMMMEPEEYNVRLLSERHRRLIKDDISGAWMPGFLTAHEGISRLLPNFFLDLKNWTMHRFWPKPENISAEISLEEAAQSVAKDVREYINATAVQFPQIAPTLTAGFDTRIILAGCRDVREQCEFFTTGSFNQGLDQIVSSKITKQLNLKHRFLDPVKSTQQEKEEWDILVGHSTHEVGRDYYKTLRGVQADVMFTGMYGETGRSRLYQKELDRIEEIKPDARFLAGRVSAPANDSEVLETLDDWLTTISWTPTWKILDLAFNELRFGGWAMAQAPASRGIQFTLMPFAQFSIQEAFMNVRPSEKTTSRLFQRIGVLLWPEAMEFSINKYDDYRDRLKIFKKLTNRANITRGWRLMKTKIR